MGEMLEQDHTGQGVLCRCAVESDWEFSNEFGRVGSVFFTAPLRLSAELHVMRPWLERLRAVRFLKGSSRSTCCEYQSRPSTHPLLKSRDYAVI